MARLNLINLTDDAASKILWSARWPQGVRCPRCDTTGEQIYNLATRGTWKCGRCRFHFSNSSGTLLAKRKMSDRQIVSCGLAYCAAKKGISSCELGRVIGMQQCSAHRTLATFREAIGNRYKHVKLRGVVEVDGAFFGGHVRHENAVKGGRKYRYSRRNGTNRRTVVVLKQRLGRTLAFVGATEADAIPFIVDRLEPGTIIQADQSHAFDSLSAMFDMLRINHKFSFKSNDACTNNAESYFAALRRMAMGTHHRISGAGLQGYATEVCWRRDHSNDELLPSLFSSLLTPVVA